MRPLADPAGFEAFVAGLPGGVTLHQQWGAHVAKVGGKVFALIGSEGQGFGGIVFKVTETSFEVLTGQSGITQAPYFAKRGWVNVAPNALPETDLKAYIAQSHRMVARALTRKQKAELGLEAYLSGTTA